MASVMKVEMSFMLAGFLVDSIRSGSRWWGSLVNQLSLRGGTKLGCGFLGLGEKNGRMAKVLSLSVVPSPHS